ncbi:WHG domain-containing protein, partial [Escherichia coli]|nr:WHG domain-containing protein [Escherichia coli]
PVPGYRAPRERTVGPGTRVVGAFFDVIAAGIAAGDVPPSEMVVPEPLSSDFEALRDEFDFAGDDGALAKGFLTWATLIGAISL